MCAAVTSQPRLRGFSLGNSSCSRSVTQRCTKAYIWELEKKPGQRPSAERIQAIAKILGVTMGDLMGEPVDEAPAATPDDVVFFREYVGMPEEEKRRYRQALEVMFGSRKDGDKK